MTPLVQAPPDRLRYLLELQRRAARIKHGIARYYDDPVGFARDCIDWGDSEGLTEYQEEVLDSIPRRKRVAVRGPHGLGKCVHYSERVRLADGSLVQASELVGASFKVLAVDPLTGDVRPARATAADNGVKPVARVTTVKGRSIVRTLNHPLWGDVDPKGHPSSRGRGRVRPQGGWVAAGDLKPGSAIALYLGNDGARVSGDENALTVLGGLLADGGTSGRGVRFSQALGPMLDAFAAAAAALGCSLRHDGRVDYNVVKAAGGRRGDPNPVLEMCRAWGISGCDSRAKRMPAFVWQLDDKSLALLLNRMFACDGWAHSGARQAGRVNREIGYASACRGLAEDVQRALLRLGISAELRPRRSSWTYKGVKKTSRHYVVGIRDVAGIRAFADRVGILGKENALQSLLATCDTASVKEQQCWQTFRLPAGFIWERIASVEILQPEPTVAITVPGPATFLTDFIEHNTGIAAIAVHWFALTRDAAGVDWKIPATAGSWHQLTQYLFPEIHKWAGRLRWDKVRDGRPYSRAHELQNLNLRLAHGSAFAGASANSALIEGAHADSLLFLFDEGKAIPAATFDACEGALGGTGEAFALALSTPGPPQGRFYDICRHLPGYEDWHPVHVTLERAVAAGRVSVEWAEQRARQWGEQSAIYQNRVLGEFYASDEDSVIPLAWAEAAAARWREWDAAGRPDTGRPRTLGVDVAREGTDRTVLAVRNGPVITELRRSVREDTMQTTGRVLAVLGTDDSRVPVVDGVGVGGGVVDRLREQGVRVLAFNAGKGSKAKDSTREFGFVGRRSEAWWTLRQALDPSGSPDICLPDDEMLLGDLSAPQWTVTSNGKIAVERKEDIRKRLGRSTDDGDACFVAGTLIATESGQVPVELVRPGMRVWTRSGLRPVLAAGLTRRNAPVLSVELEDGRTMTGTGSHPVWDGAAFRRLDTFVQTDMMWACEPSASHMAGSSSPATRTALAATIASISGRASLSAKRASARSTWRSTKPRSALSPAAGTSTTRTRTRSTTPPGILRPFRLASTLPSTSPLTADGARSTWRTWTACGNSPRRGIRLPKALRGTPRTAAGRGSAASASRRVPALAAEPSFSRFTLTATVIAGALAGASRWPRITAAGTARRRLARGATWGSSASRARPRIAPVLVRSARAEHQTADVWNLTVAGQPEYFANGILVHNCVQAFVPHLGDGSPATVRKWAGAQDLSDMGVSDETKAHRRMREIQGRAAGVPEDAPWGLDGLDGFAPADERDLPARGNVRSWR